eukprot:gnl/MRDRNA2_/MRDRNA2_167076_c0_seq1.p1 gnl/MRDRNA2_/MRDRNA2_167076_c0~~gnl/MRDRNA2_/MRDRNA2_167076_c0_seq1.p1  ORF type:complete len:174 (-),score=37.13 gnl/MRDRNA2_/MRDRNA2_167076_c0_seq1:395-880(-)
MSHHMEETGVQIDVSLLSGASLTSLVVAPSLTISSLKQQLAEHLQSGMQVRHLFANGTALENNQQVNTLGAGVIALNAIIGKSAVQYCVLKTMPVFEEPFERIQELCVVEKGSSLHVIEEIRREGQITGDVWGNIIEPTSGWVLLFDGVTGATSSGPFPLK